MSNTRKATGAAKAAPPAEPKQDQTIPEAADVQAADVQEDELDRELRELRAQVAAKEAEAADPRRQEIAKLKAMLAGDDAPAEEDERDRTIRLLKEQLAEKTATEEGAAAELRAAMRALQDQINRMQSGVGLIPVPTSEGPAPYLYGARLATGEIIYTQFPVQTHHHSDEFGLVPVESFWSLDPSHYQAAQQWANEQDQLAAARGKELANA